MPLHRCMLLAVANWVAASAEADGCPAEVSSLLQTQRISAHASTSSGVCNDGTCGPGACEISLGGSRCNCDGTFRSGTACELAGVCRFASSFDWSGLATDTDLQAQYIEEMLRWDGKFATPEAGTTLDGLTRDHVRVDSQDSVSSVAGYTAASKESLHIGMLAVVVSRARLAWHWMAGATDEDDAVSKAVQRLDRIITRYEEFNDRYPGLGGFLPWHGVTDHGFADLGTTSVTMPALDNGQLGWSMVAAGKALREAGQDTLADRYDAHVDIQRRSAKTLWVDTRRGKCRMSTRVLDVREPVSVENRRTSNIALTDPFEGELMLMYLDLLSEWGPDENRDNLWGQMRRRSISSADYTDVGLPNGPITVQTGWKFSAHELWKFLVLPYTDNALVRRLLANGERARTWHSRLNDIPGMYASCYAFNREGQSVYVDGLGVQQVSWGYGEHAPPSVTPYGAFPLALVDLGLGLAWHHAMVSRPGMQGQFGTLDSSQVPAPSASGVAAGGTEDHSLGLWPQHLADRWRCSTQKHVVVDRAACQAEAALAGHTFYYFKSDSSQCGTVARCDWPMSTNNLWRIFARPQPFPSSTPRKLYFAGQPGLCLASASPDAEGASLVLDECASSADWTLPLPTGHGPLRLSSQSTLCVGMSGQSVALHLCVAEGTRDDFQWSLPTNGTGDVRATASQQCLIVIGDRAVAGASVGLGPCGHDNSWSFLAGDGIVPPAVGYYTWDAKVTFDLAVLGGTSSILGRVLDEVPERRARFMELLEENHAPYFETLRGEETPFAAPPADAGHPGSPMWDALDFPGCRRLATFGPPVEPGSSEHEYYYDYYYDQGDHSSSFAQTTIGARGDIQMDD